MCPSAESPCAHSLVACSQHDVRSPVGSRRVPQQERRLRELERQEGRVTNSTQASKGWKRTGSAFCPRASSSPALALGDTAQVSKHQSQKSRNLCFKPLSIYSKIPHKRKLVHACAHATIHPTQGEPWNTIKDKLDTTPSHISLEGRARL